MIRKGVYYILLVSSFLVTSCNNKDTTTKLNPHSKEQGHEIVHNFEDLVDLSLEELRLKRNEIYARRGRIFISKELQQYFEGFDWYHPQHKNVEDLLNEQDQENIRKVIKAENLLKTQIIYKDESIVNESDQEYATINMQNIGGVYHAPISVNGADLFFIIDTRSSTVSLSNVEAAYLYEQGKVLNEDISGNKDFLDANGNIREGTVINLREVKVGDFIITDVKALVVNNLKAPLLLGQNALSRLGNIEVDYENETLIIKR